MNSSDNQIQINSNDFKGPKLNIELYNLTNNKKIECKKEGQQIEFIEFLGGAGLSLSVPPHSGAKGHELKLEIKLINNTPEISLSAKALVSHTEQIEGKNYRMDLELEEFEEDTWNQIIAAFSQQQEKLSELLSQLKA